MQPQTTDTLCSSGWTTCITYYVGSVINADTFYIFKSNAAITLPQGLTAIGTTPQQYLLTDKSQFGYVFGVNVEVSITLDPVSIFKLNTSQINIYYLPNTVGISAPTVVLALQSWYNETSGQFAGHMDRTGTYFAAFGVPPVSTLSSGPAAAPYAPSHTSSANQLDAGAIALVVMGGVMLIAIAAFIYTRKRGASGSSFGGGDKHMRETEENPVGPAAGAAIAKPAHKQNARKSVKVNQLPPGWQEYETDDGSAVYYFNESTGETVWERPLK